MELQIFTNEQFGQVRILEIEGQPHFVGKEVADILGYSNSRDAISKHVDEEDKLTSQIATAGQNRNMVVINESGLYSLILSSKLPQAKQFKRWMTSEVLPSIRKNGMYATYELLDNPDFAIATLQKLKEEREAKKLLEAQIEADKPKVLFANAVSASQTSILIGDFAKLLRQNGRNIGQNRLFTWLRDNGFLISRKGNSWNMPTQRSMDMGLFEIKETTISHADGHITINKIPKITGKGQVYFMEKLLDSNIA